MTSITETLPPLIKFWLNFTFQLIMINFWPQLASCDGNISQNNVWFFLLQIPRIIEFQKILTFSAWLLNNIHFLIILLWIIVTKLHYFIFFKIMNCWNFKLISKGRITVCVFFNQCLRTQKSLNNCISHV